MFDEIAALADAQGCTFTLYVDDMTITGQFATRLMQQKARNIVGSYRLRAHKSKLFAARQPRIVTGVAVTPRGLELPNRRARAIAESLRAVADTTTDSKRLMLMPTLIGRVSEAAEVDPAWRGHKEAAVKMRREVRARVVQPLTFASG